MSDAYKQAGVDIEAGYEAVRRMGDHVQRTMRPEVLGGLGSFGAMFELPVDRYRQPVLVSGTDGVGTKLKLAFAMEQHETIGIDAVAMCVNDIVVQGAEPLYFLDYIATDRVVPEKMEAIVRGIADGCEQAGCALIGGETAEMPGMYQNGEYDVAGFCVGVVEKQSIITGESISAGDVLIGLGSNGIHSNGFSLVRRVLLDQAKMELSKPWQADRRHITGEEEAMVYDAPDVPKQQTLGESLLQPTRIYVKTVLELINRYTIHGLAHITGGGFPENVPRMLPDTCTAVIEPGTWPVHDIFHLIQDKGDILAADMYRTFNMGIGLVIAVPQAEADAVLEACAELGERAYAIGHVRERQPSDEQPIVIDGIFGQQAGA